MVTTSRLKAYGALAGMFVLGAVSSAAAYHAFARQKDAELMSGDRSNFEARLVEALGRDLDLRDDQLHAVRGIFQKHSEERRRLFRQEVETCGGPMTAHRERVDAEIRALLTPEQRGRFDTLREERRRRLFGDQNPRPSASP
jgi:Spy/CpxP family protein refolding chaperone